MGVEWWNWANREEGCYHMWRQSGSEKKQLKGRSENVYLHGKHSVCVQCARWMSARGRGNQCTVFRMVANWKVSVVLFHWLKECTWKLLSSEYQGPVTDVKQSKGEAHHSPHLMSELRMHVAFTLICAHIFMLWCLRDNFTFTVWYKFVIKIVSVVAHDQMHYGNKNAHLCCWTEDI